MKLLLVVALAGVAHAMCPDSCSGHGTCGSEDTCSCYGNWQGANCADRTCPYSYAFVDAFATLAEHGLTAADSGHWYAECSNKGLCDRKTGQCDCFEGYEGKACRRSSCPNGCSGHGTCEFQNELGSYYDWDAEKIQGCKCDGGYEGPDCSLRKCPRGDDPLTHTVDTAGTTWTAQIDEKQVFAIFWMDGFRNVGNTAAAADATDADAWHTEVNTRVAGRTTNHQVLGNYEAGVAANSDHVPPHEITLTYTDTNGHSWTTIPIELDSEIVANTRAANSFAAGGLVSRRTAAATCTDSSGVSAAGQCLENDIKEALESLPNRVIDDVTVTVTKGTCGTEAAAVSKCSAVTHDSVALWSASRSSLTHAGVTAGTDNQPITFGAAANIYTYYKVEVEFTGAEVSGNQNALQVNIDRCIEAGCQPVTRGIPSKAIGGGTDGNGIGGTADATNTYWRGEDMWVTQVASTDGTKEANECSDRGSCDKSTGLCSCFSGYTGQMCQQQTAIV